MGVRQLRAVATVVLIGLGLAAVGKAHNLGTTVAALDVGAVTFELRLECDLDALALGAGPGADDSELAATLAAMSDDEIAELRDDLRSMFLRRVRLLAGDTRLDFEVDFPDREAGLTLGMEPPTFLGLTARLRGQLPAEANSLRLRLSRAFPPAEITAVDANGDVLHTEIVPRGEDSAVFRIRPLEEAEAGPGWSRARLIAAAGAVATLIVLIRRRRGR